MRTMRTMTMTTRMTRMTMRMMSPHRAKPARCAFHCSSDPSDASLLHGRLGTPAGPVPTEHQ